MKRIVLVLILVLLLVNFANADWLEGWDYRKQITVSDVNVDGDLTNFPLYVKISADSAIGGHARADGNDIRFTLSDGITLVDANERESWAVNGGTATADFYVKVPTINATGGAVIYVYYGNNSAGTWTNATGVWDANFKAVWHLKDATSTTIADSTVNANTGTKYASGYPVEAAGVIGLAQDFDGGNSLVNLGTMNDTIFTEDGPTTVSVWMKPDTLGGASGGRILERGGPSLRLTTTNRLTFDVAGSTALSRISANNSITLEQWQHVAMTWDGSTTAANVHFYINNVEPSYSSTVDGASPTDNSATVCYMGNTSARSRGFDGIMDEIRVSNMVRSAAWLKFTYHNSASGTNELTWGSEETEGEPPPPPEVPISAYRRRISVNVFIRDLRIDTSVIDTS